jgi:DNA-binding protein
LEVISMARTILPLAAMEKLLKKSGAERVSEDAKDELREVLEAYAEELGKKAVKFSEHSGRKTVKAADVRLAKTH